MSYCTEKLLRLAMQRIMCRHQHSSGSPSLHSTPSTQRTHWGGTLRYILEAPSYCSLRAFGIVSASASMALQRLLLLSARRWVLSHACCQRREGRMMETTFRGGGGGGATINTYKLLATTTIECSSPFPSTFGKERKKKMEWIGSLYVQQYFVSFYIPRWFIFL